MTSLRKEKSRERIKRMIQSLPAGYGYPSCHSEYLPNVDVCPDYDELLVESIREQVIRDWMTALKIYQDWQGKELVEIPDEIAAGVHQAMGLSRAYSIAVRWKIENTDTSELSKYILSDEDASS